MSSRAGNAAEEVTSVRDKLDRYIELQTKISTARNDWRIGEEMLRERIDVVRREIETLEEDIAKMRGDITEADQEREKLVDENEKLKNTSAVLRDTVMQYEGRTKSLITKLPPPAAADIRPLAQRLPDDPQQTDVSLSNRYQNVIGILNQLDKFNQNVTTSSQTREVAPSDSREVDTLYVGLGVGYYAGPNAEVGGRGYPTADGWRWSEENDAAPEVVTALAIFNNEETATFVQLPLRVERHDQSDSAARNAGAETPSEDAQAQSSRNTASEEAASGEASEATPGRTNTTESAKASQNAANAGSQDAEDKTPTAASAAESSGEGSGSETDSSADVSGEQ